MARDATIHDLPDDLLARAMVPCTKHEGPTLTLVCKKWRRVFYEVPDFWQTYQPALGRLRTTTDARWPAVFQAQLAQLARTSGRVTTFVFDAFRLPKPQQPPPEQQQCWRLADYLAALQPGMVRKLRLLALPALPSAAVPLISGMVHLTRLQLDVGAQLQPAALQALGQLTQLQSFNIETDSCEGLLEGAVLQLTALTRLVLASGSLLPAAALMQLTRLASLRHLELSEDVDAGDGADLANGDLQLPDLAALGSGGRLHTLNLHSSARRFKVAGGRVRGCKCAQGNSLEGRPALHVEVVGGQSLPPLQRFLAALLGPLGGAPIEQLQLGSTALPAAAPGHGSLACLAGLRRLHMEECSTAGGAGMEAFLRDVLAAATGLQELVIMGHDNERLRTVPVPLQSQRGLTRLVLCNLHLTELPAGPYLSGLQHLDLRHNNLHFVPAALAEATALETLDLSVNEHLVLSPAGVDLLAALPALESVSLLDIRKPGLEVQRLAEQRLDGCEFSWYLSDFESEDEGYGSYSDGSYVLSSGSEGEGSEELEGDTSGGEEDEAD